MPLKQAIHNLSKKQKLVKPEKQKIKTKSLLFSEKKTYSIILT